MVVLVTMVIDVAPVTSAPGCKALVTSIILYRLFCIDKIFQHCHGRSATSL